MSISKEKFKEMLREKGLKVTNQRILVLEVLADHRDKHLTAEDIYELVREDYPEIGLATIYRTVQLLWTVYSDTSDCLVKVSFHF